MSTFFSTPVKLTSPPIATGATVVLKYLNNNTGVHSVEIAATEIVDADIPMAPGTALYQTNATVSFPTWGNYTLLWYTKVGIVLTFAGSQALQIERGSGLQSVAPPAITTFTLYGNLIDLATNPIVNEAISARIIAPPTILTGVGVTEEVTSVVSDANGYFELEVIKGSTIDISIQIIGYRRTLIAEDPANPGATSANLFDL